MFTTNRIDKQLACLLFIPSNDSIISSSPTSTVDDHERIDDNNNKFNKNAIDSSVEISSSSITSISVSTDDLQYSDDDYNESTLDVVQSTHSILSNTNTTMTQLRRGGRNYNKTNDTIPRYIELNFSHKNISSKNDNTPYIQLCFDPMNNAMATEWIGHRSSNTVTDPLPMQRNFNQNNPTINNLTDNESVSMSHNIDTKESDIIKSIDSSSSTYVLGSFDPFSFDSELGDIEDRNDDVAIEWVFREFDPVTVFANKKLTLRQQKDKSS
jgi:hypothetical protein